MADEEHYEQHEDGGDGAAEMHDAGAYEEGGYAEGGLEDEGNGADAGGTDAGAKSEGEAGDVDDAEQANKAEVDARSVYVGNVDYGATPEELQQHFSGCGTVNRVTILTDRFGGPKGYAYIEFLEADAVDNAIMLDNSELRARQLKVVRKRTNVPGMKVRGRGRGRGHYQPYYPRGGYRGRGGWPPRGRGRGRGYAPY